MNCSRLACLVVTFVTSNTTLAASSAHSVPCTKVWPDSELPDFRPLMKTFYTSCHQLVNRLLELMGKALQLEVSVLCVYVCVWLN